MFPGVGVDDFVEPVHIGAFPLEHDRVLVSVDTIEGQLEIVLDNGAVVGLKEVVPQSPELLRVALQQRIHLVCPVRNGGPARDVAV